MARDSQLPVWGGHVSKSLHPGTWLLNKTKNTIKETTWNMAAVPMRSVCLRENVPPSPSPLPLFYFPLCAPEPGVLKDLTIVTPHLARGSFKSTPELLKYYFGPNQEFLWPMVLEFLQRVYKDFDILTFKAPKIQDMWKVCQWLMRLEKFQFTWKCFWIHYSVTIFVFTDNRY